MFWYNNFPLIKEIVREIGYYFSDYGHNILVQALNFVMECNLKYVTKQIHGPMQCKAFTQQSLRLENDNFFH